MTEQEMVVDIEKTIVKLQELGMHLKAVIFVLPNSAIKQYLLFEISKVIEFKAAIDFYYLQNKISRMMDMVTQWNLDGEILKLLEEISIGVKKTVQYVERERKG